VKRLCILNIFLSISCCGCVLFPQPTIDNTQSQLEIREYQTREYETNDSKLVMKAVLNALQDDRFIVKNAVPDVGLVTAEKEIPVLYRRGDSPQDLEFSPDRWNATKVEECSVNITEYGQLTKVRVNFLTKLINKRKGIIRTKGADDLKQYQEFFAKIDKGIFLQKENL